MDIVRCNAFVSESEGGKYLEVKNLLLHCLFEGQSVPDYMAILGRNKIYSNQTTSPRPVQSSRSSPLDRYALGYCISNCSTRTTVIWKVKMEFGSGDSFVWGLNSNHRGNGVIVSHEMDSVVPTCLDSYPYTILSGIKHLGVHLAYRDDNTEQALLQVLPLMKNLTSLGLTFPSPQMVKSSLSAISQSNLTQLRLKIKKYNETCLLFISGLINSLSKLTIRVEGLIIMTLVKLYCQQVTPNLCDALFKPSSLNQLTLRLPHFAENCFDLLETNTCLTTVDIDSDEDLLLEPLFRILERNKTVESLKWSGHRVLSQQSMKELEKLDNSLSSNTTLKRLTLVIVTNICPCHIDDTRVALRCAEV